MELQGIKTLLVRFLEGDQLMEEEGKQLLAGLERLIAQQEEHLLVGMRYYIEEEKILSEEELRVAYWEVDMFYGHHEEDDHHHGLEEEGDAMHKWGWLYALLTGVVAAMAYWLIATRG
jgi:hypothetical protein